MTSSHVSVASQFFLCNLITCLIIRGENRRCQAVLLGTLDSVTLHFLQIKAESGVSRLNQNTRNSYALPVQIIVEGSLEFFD
jgi:hypothetical protein